MNVEYRCLLPVDPGQGSYRFDGKLVCGQKHFLPPGGTTHKCTKHDQVLSQTERYEGHLFEPTDVHGQVKHRPTTGAEVAQPSVVETKEDLVEQEAALMRQLESIRAKKEDAPYREDVPHLTPPEVREVNPTAPDEQVGDIPSATDDPNNDQPVDVNQDEGTTSDEDLWVPPIPENATKDQLRSMYALEYDMEPDGRYSEDTLRTKIMEKREENMRAELKAEEAQND